MSDRLPCRGTVLFFCVIFLALTAPLGAMVENNLLMLRSELPVPLPQAGPVPTTPPPVTTEYGSWGSTGASAAPPAMSPTLAAAKLAVKGALIAVALNGIKGILDILVDGFIGLAEKKQYQDKQTKAIDTAREAEAAIQQAKKALKADGHPLPDYSSPGSTPSPSLPVEIQELHKDMRQLRDTTNDLLTQANTLQNFIDAAQKKPDGVKDGNIFLRVVNWITGDPWDLREKRDELPTDPGKIITGDTDGSKSGGPAPTQHAFMSPQNGMMVARVLVTPGETVVRLFDPDAGGKVAAEVRVTEDDDGKVLPFIVGGVALASAGLFIDSGGSGGKHGPSTGSSGPASPSGDTIARTLADGD
ncbi:MAG: hypothetical protein RDV41_01940, partial [Planctomycetota bacterium]|nr:hypothetical protein [Planctomycetota bacterium]